MAVSSLQQGVRVTVIVTLGIGVTALLLHLVLPRATPAQCVVAAAVIMLALGNHVVSLHPREGER